MSGKGGRPGDAHPRDHGSGVGVTADMYDDHHDDLAITQDGGTSSSSDEDDLDGDADLDDDDMMDKISSSPSIEDGGSHSAAVPPAWPPRLSSLPSCVPRPLPSPRPSRAERLFPNVPVPSIPLDWTSVQHQQVGAAAAEWHCNHHLPRGEYASRANDSVGHAESVRRQSRPRNAKHPASLRGAGREKSRRRQSRSQPGNPESD